MEETNQRLDEMKSLWYEAKELQLKHQIMNVFEKEDKEKVDKPDMNDLQKTEELELKKRHDEISKKAERQHEILKNAELKLKNEKERLK